MNRMYERVPLPEVNFFAIVLVIQAKAGGNLSEALGNLSTVLRARKMLREKIKALVGGSQDERYDHWRDALCGRRHVGRDSSTICVVAGHNRFRARRASRLRGVDAPWAS
jgi:hypothetical protein